MNLHEIVEKYEQWTKDDLKRRVGCLEQNRVVFGELDEFNQGVLRAVHGHEGLEWRAAGGWRPQPSTTEFIDALTYRVAQGFDFEEAWKEEEETLRPMGPSLEERFPVGSWWLADNIPACRELRVRKVEGEFVYTERWTRERGVEWWGRFKGETLDSWKRIPNLPERVPEGYELLGCFEPGGRPEGEGGVWFGYGSIWEESGYLCNPYSPLHEEGVGRRRWYARKIEKPEEPEWCNGKRIGALYETPDGLRALWDRLASMEFDGWKFMGFSRMTGQEWDRDAGGYRSPFYRREDRGIGMYKYAVWEEVAR